MSVSASERIGRVATHIACFRGLDQLYSVKVWAVSGPSISQQAQDCISDGQCRKEGGRAMTIWLCTANGYTLVSMVSILLKVKQQNINVY